MLYLQIYLYSNPFLLSLLLFSYFKFNKLSSIFIDVTCVYVYYIPKDFSYSHLFFTHLLLYLLYNILFLFFNIFMLVSFYIFHKVKYLLQHLHLKILEYLASLFLYSYYIVSLFFLLHHLLHFP